MKHIKAYETKEEEEEHKICGRDENLLFINFPSEVYFKSDIKFQLVLVDSIYKKIEEGDVTYRIKSDNSVQFSQYQNGRESFSYIIWDKLYYEDEFKKINLMHPKEFYRTYESSYIRIFETVLDRLEEDNFSSEHKEQLEEIVKRLSIPEVKYIVQQRKYNL